MEEIVTYIGKGFEDDKHGEKSIGYSISSYSNIFSYAYKSAYSYRNGCVSTGFLQGDNDKLLVAIKDKALINVYIHGKEVPIQKIPVPEKLTALAFSKHNGKSGTNQNNSSELPWLLVGGSISGKLYIWEMSSGNLLIAKSMHYQQITKIEFTNNNNYLITSSLDSRVLIFYVTELISSRDPTSLKPLTNIKDNTLPVTDFHVTTGLNNDLKLVTVSLDSTCRVYDISTGKLQLTIVSSYKIHALAVDPVGRSIYFGLENGSIREVKLYKIDPNTQKIFHLIDGTTNKIITLEDDTDIKESFIMHQQLEGNKDCNICSLDVSFDGTLLYSGDSLGNVLVSDIVSKQTVKSFKKVAGEVLYMKVFPTLSKDPNNDKDILSGKKVSNINKAIPVLKRAIADSIDIATHELHVKLPENDFHYKLINNNHKIDYNADMFFGQVAAQEQIFKLMEFGESKTRESNSYSLLDKEISDLRAKLEKVTSSYKELRGIHEELFESHTKLLNETKK